MQSDDPTVAKWQSTLDFGGYGAKPAQAAEAAEKRTQTALRTQELSKVGAAT